MSFFFLLVEQMSDNKGRGRGRGKQKKHHSKNVGSGQKTSENRNKQQPGAQRPGGLVERREPDFPQPSSQPLTKRSTQVVKLREDHDLDEHDCTDHKSSSCSTSKKGEKGNNRKPIPAEDITNTPRKPKTGYTKGATHNDQPGIESTATILPSLPTPPQSVDGSPPKIGRTSEPLASTSSVLTPPHGSPSSIVSSSRDG